ncbi:MAG: class I tRNA ligase family protein, partial [Actinobacteria bacterium]|nr:class I tRNA ligase family protein [Actinomycetota bacterium]
GRLAIEPASRRNEVLGFIDGGLADISVSRSVQRAGGWGIGVPDDPGQVIYVWWDALGNYISSLGYGAPGTPGPDADYRRWWVEADRRVHLVGKGVLRFHAVYWPAILLSAGVPLPTEIFVHDYLTLAGSKISKSAAGSQPNSDPAALAAAYSPDALRWWLLRDVPRTGDTDFTIGRLIARANTDLANGVGNLISRVTSIAHSYRNGVVCARSGPDGANWPADAATLLATVERTPAAVHAALGRFDFRAAAAAVFETVEEANRYVEATEPWHLGRADRAGDAAAGRRLDEVLGALVGACQALAGEISPFLPDLAGRVAAAVDNSGGTLPRPQPVFPRIPIGQTDVSEVA